MPEGFPSQTLSATSDQVEALRGGTTTLLEMYGDQVVTFKGITAPIGALIGLCPRPVAEMEPGKINSWTADILSQSGLELPQAVAPLVEPVDAKKK